MNVAIIVLSIVAGLANILLAAHSISMAVERFKAGRYFSFGMFVMWAVLFAAFTVRFIVWR